MLNLPWFFLDSTKPFIIYKCRTINKGVFLVSSLFMVTILLRILDSWSSHFLQIHTEKRVHKLLVGIGG
ncbi:hypothetical protein MBAV_000464 [Candidatus Magnetobacterium bavaricum]|uniref:Uncharacterized protein n=1 Tax=Candidatus Magnetobacterium bavaricum TaxID=29290 RepID=A0A0F3H350_9BACT|nr:hypothetical protein MBAV_000464 [Candidatus Magnetobacterium bavaricum]